MWSVPESVCNHSQGLFKIRKVDLLGVMKFYGDMK